MKPAYYNEFDLETAEWLRELIRQGHIAPGDVDTRSIEDVRPDDLRGYAQCHFFAGIGVWSYALRRAGWPDDRPVWTGSCPCQPFSAAGKGAAFADERHLWPAFNHLIKVGRPPVVLGEQVASAAVDAWIDLVHADVEALGYSFGSVPFPSAGVGAPHIRDRNYWVAQSSSERRERGQGAARRSLADRDYAGRIEGNNGASCADETGLRLGDTGGERLAQRERERGILGRAPGAVKGQAAVGASLHPGGLANADGWIEGNGGIQRQQQHRLAAADRGALLQDRGGAQPEVPRPDTAAGPTNGFWSAADWLGCRDGKFRPVEPGTFPLVTGASARVVRLRGYGNAINAEAAQAWIETVMECLP